MCRHRRRRRLLITLNGTCCGGAGAPSHCNRYGSLKLHCPDSHEITHTFAQYFLLLFSIFKEIHYR